MAQPKANHPTNSARRRYQNRAASAGIGRRGNARFPATCRIQEPEETAQDQGQAQHDGGHQIGKDDLSQKRRPVEGQKGSDASEPEDRHFRETERETQADGAQPLRPGLHRQGKEPLLWMGGHFPEHPFGSGAQGNEPEDEDEHPHEAAPLQLGKQAICGASKFAWQPGRGGGQGGEVLPQACGPSRHHLGCGRCGLRRRRRRRRLMLLVDPSANGRILQQLEKLLHLRRRRAQRRGGLTVGGRNPHEHDGH